MRRRMKVENVSSCLPRSPFLPPSLIPFLLGIHNLTCYHVICLPVLGSVMLLVFFYFFEFIQYFYTILCAGWSNFQSDLLIP